jgi:hypothetical protein
MDCKIAENNFHIKTDRLKLFDAAVGAVPAAAAAAIAPACEVGGGKNHESLYGKVKVRPFAEGLCGICRTVCLFHRLQHENKNLIPLRRVIVCTELHDHGFDPAGNR